MCIFEKPDFFVYIWQAKSVKKQFVVYKHSKEVFVVLKNDNLGSK